MVDGLNRTLDIPWPPGLYRQGLPIMDISDQLLHISGRQAVTVVDGRIVYTPWRR
jgi:hypothetical protein